MRKVLFVTVLMVTLQGLAHKAAAQVDPHFSLYYVYPSWLNPGLTGAFDGQLRVSGIYRNQWGNVSAPFSTPGVSLDFTTEKNLNFGISAMKQKAGDGGYSYTTAYGSVAYTGVRFDGGMKRLVFGMQGGMIQRRFDATKLTFGDQWNPVTGYTPSNPTADVIRNNNKSTFDMGAGVMYFDAEPGKKSNLFAGYSASHITRPDDQFSAFGNARIPVRHTIHAGVRINMNEQFSLTPNALYLKQGTATETMVGAYGQIKLNGQNEFMLGANYRFKDALSPFVGFPFGSMLLSASYDVNMSDLGKLAKGTNSFELSLTFIKKKSVKTPEAEFVCPRL